MDTIKDNFRRYGENFKMEIENKNGFLFSRTDPKTKITYYEVFNKRKSIPHPHAEKITHKYVYPGEECFGRWAWCYRNKDEAMTKFINLN